jgi:hypothetical protein
MGLIRITSWHSSSSDGPLLKGRRGVTLFARATEGTAMNIIGAVTAVARRRQGDFCHDLEFVAGMAVKFGMRPGQCKTGLPCMIEAPPRPAIRVVTHRAPRPKPSFVMYILVARGAHLRGLLIAWRSMALLARHCGMTSNQWKSRDVVIKGDLLPPTCVLVTLLTSRTQLSLVRIVFFVARNARHAQFVTVEITDVAGIALRRGVKTAKWKFSEFVVIELDDRPLLRGVAGLTFCAISPCVFVLDGMTADARDRQILILLTHVTGRTCDFLMCANQGKFRLGMIKCFGPPPAVFSVATVARVAEASFMRVNRFVAIDATPSCRPIRLLWLMAALAPYRPMFALQCEISQRMIERLAIELQNIGLTAFVVGMALLTLRLGRGVVATMKAPRILPVRRDLLMAAQA